jgi:uncharacterized protein YqcC (DUF446 family)
LNESEAHESAAFADADTPGERENDDDDGDAPGVTNETLFRDAVTGLESAVPAWEMQLEMALGHKTPLTLSWDSLGGRYELVQGMVHVGVVQSLGAVCAVGFDPATKDTLSQRVKAVRVEHRAGAEPGSRVALDSDELVFSLDMAQEVTGPPDGSLGDELRRLLESPRAGVDRPQAALAYMSRLEDAMRRENLWPGDAPAGPIEVRGAFGCENMAFAQWLAWVLIPRVKEIVASGGSFPAGSQVGAYAVRELDGADAPEVIALLSEFDRFIEAGGQ